MSAARRRGSKFEQDVCDYLRATGHPLAERRVQGGSLDRGDIAGIPGWVIEAKATSRIDLSGAIDEAKKEAINDGAMHYAAIFKRRNHAIADAYCVIPLWLLAELMVDE